MNDMVKGIFDGTKIVSRMLLFIAPAVERCRYYAAIVEALTQGYSFELVTLLLFLAGPLPAFLR